LISPVINMQKEATVSTYADGLKSSMDTSKSLFNTSTFVQTSILSSDKSSPIKNERNNDFTKNQDLFGTLKNKSGVIDVKEIIDLGVPAKKQAVKTAFDEVNKAIKNATTACEELIQVLPPGIKFDVESTDYIGSNLSVLEELLGLVEIEETSRVFNYQKFSNSETSTMNNKLIESCSTVSKTPENSHVRRYNTRSADGTRKIRIMYDDAKAGDKGFKKDNGLRQNKKSSPQKINQKLKTFENAYSKTSMKMPTIPKGSFGYFFEDYYAKVKISHPSESLSQVMKDAGVRWREMTENDKLVYRERQNAARERYKNEMQQYKEQTIIPQDKPKKSNKKATVVDFSGRPLFKEFDSSSSEETPYMNVKPDKKINKRAVVDTYGSSFLSTPKKKVGKEEQIALCHGQRMISQLKNVKKSDSTELNLAEESEERIQFSWKELKSLVEDNLLRENFEKPANWKDQASSNIASIKDIIKNEKTKAHERLIAKLSEVDVKNYLQIPNDDYAVLASKRAGIRNLRKDPLIKNICAEFVKKRDETSHSYKLVLSQSEKVVHDRWVEENYGRERIVRNVADVLLQEMKTNALHKVLRGSEGSKVEIVSQLVDAVMWHLPLEYDVEVTRGERQSVASKDRKLQQNNNARGDRPDLMIQAFLRQKWDEIAYVESGKWKTTNKKIFTSKFYRIWAKIPLNVETVDEVEDFVHALLILRLYKLISNMQDQRDKPKDLSELDLLRQRIIDLETENAEIPELRNKLLKFAEVETENKRLRQIVEENSRRDAEFKSRIEELEKSRTDTASENAELKTEVAKLRHDFEEIKSKGIIIDSP
ncbi:11580_t:CDS:2, partial [Scutellospora calospora]